MGRYPVRSANLRRIQAMNAYVASVIESVKQKHGNEPEFVQTVEEVLT